MADLLWQPRPRASGMLCERDLNLYITEVLLLRSLCNSNLAANLLTISYETWFSDFQQCHWGPSLFHCLCSVSICVYLIFRLCVILPITGHYSPNPKTAPGSSWILTEISAASVCLVAHRVQLFVTPWTVALQAPLSKGILYTRILGSSQLRDRTQVSCITGGFFTIWATREVHTALKSSHNTLQRRGIFSSLRGTGQLRRKVTFFSKSGEKKEIWKHNCRNRHSKDIVLAGSNRWQNEGVLTQWPQSAQENGRQGRVLRMKYLRLIGRDRTGVATQMMH